MKLHTTLLVLYLMVTALALSVLIGSDNQDRNDENDVLISLGINKNDEVLESSGLAYSRFVENSIWTLNDSGHSNQLLLLKTDGTLQAKVSIAGVKNIDWEAMAGFALDGKPYLAVADVGDNLNRRQNYQIHLLPEPDLSSALKSETQLPIEKSVQATSFQFTYEDGPKNCEAIGVDVVGKKIWLVEKVYYDAAQKTPPGIYTLPLSVDNADPLMIAKRIANFPPRNVTGMDFSPDGKRLIIRNYVNAHLYSRNESNSWKHTVLKTKPVAVVLPLQRQGEAVCFAPDSKSVILTSELKRQPIWQVMLQQYFDQPTGKTNKETQPNK